jgi:hypothetical protein
MQDWSSNSDCRAQLWSTEALNAIGVAYRACAVAALRCQQHQQNLPTYEAASSSG